MHRLDDSFLADSFSAMKQFEKSDYERFVASSVELFAKLAQYAIQCRGLKFNDESVSDNNYVENVEVFNGLHNLWLIYLNNRTKQNGTATLKKISEGILPVKRRISQVSISMKFSYIYLLSVSYQLIDPFYVAFGCKIRWAAAQNS